jgi:pyruvate formate lyase activating enzyme
VTSPVFELQRFSIHDGPGIRTTVFLRGCPLRCAWCQNPEGMEPPSSVTQTWSEEVMRGVCADRTYFEVSGGGVTLSGGEPLLDVTHATTLLSAAKSEGLHTCVQTCGAVPTSTMLAVLPLVDLFQFDLKHVDEETHREWTGAGTSRIHQNAKLLVEHGAQVQFRMPVLPGINDDAAHLERLAAFLATLGVHALRLVPYHRHYLAKYEALGRVSRVTDLKAPTADGLARIVQQLKERGLEVAVDGAAT